MMLCTLFILFVIASKACGETEKPFFRFDYEYNGNVEGWLKFHPIPATWFDARLRCAMEGAVLASPNNKKLSAAMMDMIKHISDCGIYSGIHAIFSKGDFYTVEGIPLLRMPVEFTEGEPNNEGNTEDCILFLSNGTIADVNCTQTFPYICYKKKTSNMFLTNCGTTDKEYTYERKTGSCYKFHHIGRTWKKAFMTCASEGGYLAIINNHNEASILSELFQKNCGRISNGSSKGVMLLGFHTWDDQGVFTTIHGQSLEEAGYEVWEKGQPDNARPGEPCGAMYKNGKLDDIWCDYIASFVCEKNPDSLLPINGE